MFYEFKKPFKVTKKNGTVLDPPGENIISKWITNGNVPGDVFPIDGPVTGQPALT